MPRAISVQVLEDGPEAPKLNLREAPRDRIPALKPYVTPYHP